MALFSPVCNYSKVHLRFRINSSIPRLIVPESGRLCLLRSKNSRISVQHTLSNPSRRGLQNFCTNASSSSTSSSNSFVESDELSNIVFVKGLAQSTSEKSLMAEFSQFGEVGRVKIVKDKKTRQSLGFAYVWLTSNESVQVAVEEINGKFFDGRFIYVTIARPGSCKPQVEEKRYKSYNMQSK